MRWFGVFSIVLSSIITCSGNIIELTDSNFNSEILKYPVSLVKFYAPWCGHCKNLAPTFSKAADELNGIAQLVKVNCDEQKTTCSNFDVKGFPTLKIFKNGEFFEEYKGGRDLDSIVNIMKKHSTPPSKVFATEFELEQYLKNIRRYTIVGRITSQHETEYISLAAKLRDSYEFLQLKLDSSRTSTIEIHKPFYLRTNLEDNFVSTNFESSDESLEFISSKRNGLVGECDSLFHASYSLPLMTVKLPFDVDRSSSSWKQYRNRLFKLAQEHTELTFCVIKNTEFSKLYTSLTDEPEMISLVIENKQGHKFLENFEPTSATEFVGKVTSFIESYKNGKVEPTDSVVTLTSQNFDDIVYKSNKNVMIKFYAPWCGHCKKLAPIYEQLSNKYKDNGDIVIAKFDATAHEPPAKFKVEGFPTLYFVDKDYVDNPIAYNNDRTLEALSSFIDSYLDQSSEL